MFKKLFRTLFTILGAILGYGAFELLHFWMVKSGAVAAGEFSQWQQIVIGLIFAILFGLIFFRLTPVIRRQSVKVADNIEDDLRGVSANDLLTEMCIRDRLCIYCLRGSQGTS